MCQRGLNKTNNNGKYKSTRHQHALGRTDTISTIATGKAVITTEINININNTAITIPEANRPTKSQLPISPARAVTVYQHSSIVQWQD